MNHLSLHCFPTLSLKKEEIKEEVHKKSQFELYNINNLTPCSKEKLPCDHCNSADCIFCPFSYSQDDLVSTLKNSQVKQRSYLCYLNYNNEEIDINKLITIYKKIYPENRYFTKFTSNMEKEYSIDNCITQLSMKEQLDKDNTWYCPKCKEHREAFKQLEIMICPKILIIQIKRFKPLGYFVFATTKNETFVDYPIDLEIKNTKYKLFAISQHIGNTFFGHYKAACFCEGDWYIFNDDNVDKAPSNKSIVNSNGYLLFYEKVNEQ